MSDTSGGTCTACGQPTGPDRITVERFCGMDYEQRVGLLQRDPDQYRRLAAEVKAQTAAMEVSR